MFQGDISTGSAIKESLDLNRFLIKHPAATFILRVSGSSMVKAGIHDNDILIVDRSLEPQNGKIVVVAMNGELTIKRCYIQENAIQFASETDDFLTTDLKNKADFHIWGVVTSVIHLL